MMPLALRQDERAQESMSFSPSTIKTTLKMLRAQQWTKNVLVFAPLVFAGLLFEPTALARSSAAFIIFSLASSVGYIINDVFDRERDRQHPGKRQRPLARGLVSVRVAVAAAAFIAALSLAIGFFLQTALGFLLLSYLFLSLSYSAFLKHIPVVELAVVALFYVARISAGTLVLTIPLSAYMTATTFLLALVIIVTKRLQDKMSGANGIRPVLVFYNASALKTAFYLLSGTVLLAYSFWVRTLIQDRHLEPTWLLVLSVIFVALGIIKFFTLMVRSHSPQDIEQVIWHPLFLAIGVAWLLTVTIPLYL